MKHSRITAQWIAFCALLAACGGEDETAVGGTPSGEMTAVEPALPADDPAPATKWYAIATEIYGADFATSTSFVRLVPSLDAGEIELATAREYNGRATVATVGKWLFIMDGEVPIIDRFIVGADGTLTLDAQLSFANYGMPYWTIDAWGNVMVSPTKAYFSNPGDGSLIVWNPTSMQIIREIPLPTSAPPELELQASPAVLRGGQLFQLFSWGSFDRFEFSQVPQQLGVYDVETDELVSLTEESRCPAVYSQPFEDEAGSLYFSNHVWSPMETLVKGAPQSCSLRVLAGETTFDPDWQLRYADFADGREGAVLRYTGNGQGLADIFYDERMTITSATDPAELGQSSNWRLWTVDLAAGTGAPIEAFDYKPGGYNDVEVDGRTWLLMPSADYARTTGYELVDGAPVERFGIQGSSYHLVELTP
ncbi:MAG TPA: hypothetical protein VMG12_25910 [Polyangiaceae bacterium]|nr:hypothetical protein [Polyangiaceae bacterium]